MMSSDIKSVVTLAAGISLCGVTSYLIYLFLKKHSDDDDDFETISIPVLQSKIELEVPKDCVRNIIGRNGFKIREIEKQTQTKIMFKEGRNDDYQIGLIKGSKKNCILAESIINEIIASQPLIEVKKILVPQCSIGRIIGKCGERINYITQMSGAKCHISDIVYTDNIEERTIVLKGTLNQIESAKTYIFSVVKQDEEIRKKIDFKLAQREPRGKIKNSSKSDLTMKLSSEKLSTNTSMRDGQLEVYVSAIIDPSQFWLQIVGPKANELDQLVEEMTEYYSKTENQELHKLIEPTVGDIVAAVFMYDGKWYRAEITELKEEKNKPVACLYFLDYGDTDTIFIEEIFELRTDFLRLRFQAIECYLARVKPVNNDWSTEAVDKFEEWTKVAQWKKLRARVNGYKERTTSDRYKREGSPIPGVDLYDVNNQEDIDIAMELVRHGYAVLDGPESVNLNDSSATTSIATGASDDHILNGNHNISSDSNSCQNDDVQINSTKVLNGASSANDKETVDENGSL